MATLPTVASIFRKTKFSRFDPGLNQVYEANKYGKWGTKARIPPKLPGKTLTMTMLDSKYSAPFFKLADAKCLAMERFKELFPKHVTGLQVLTKPPTLNLATLSQSEFLNFCEKKKGTPWTEWSKQLCLTLTQGVVQGPVYSTPRAMQSSQVYGRPLAKQPNQTFVAVGGFLGIVSDRIHLVRPELTLFNVEKIKWSKHGAPTIYLCPCVQPITKKPSKNAYSKQATENMLDNLMNYIDTCNGKSNIDSTVSSPSH